MNKKVTIILITFMTLISLISIYTIVRNARLYGNESHLGTGGVSSNNFDEWETNLHLKANELFSQAFGEDHVFNFDDQGEFSFTLEELKNNYNLDFSEFNNKEVSCDLQKSKVIVYIEDTEIMRNVSLSCINTK